VVAVLEMIAESLPATTLVPARGLAASAWVAVLLAVTFAATASPATVAVLREVAMTR
jgi:hypothetical protein